MHRNHLIITRGRQYFQPREWICICQSFRGLLTYVNPVCVLGVILCCKCELDAKQSVEKKNNNPKTKHEGCEVWKGQRWILKKQNHIHINVSVFIAVFSIEPQIFTGSRFPLCLPCPCFLYPDGAKASQMKDSLWFVGRLHISLEIWQI